MNYIGKWGFHSIGTFGEEAMEFLTAEEYLNFPMEYIDETDEEEVAHEMQERQKQIGSKIVVCEDGNMYMLSPLPENVSQEEIDKAVSAGIIKLYDGMITDEPMKWEERDGEFWCEFSFGEEGMSRCSDDDGNIMIMTTKYAKEE